MRTIRLYFLSFVWLTSLLLMSLDSTSAMAQPDGFNYDENKVPGYELPALLVDDQGDAVKTVEQWETKRRPTILKLFKDHVYGHQPDLPFEVHSKTIESGECFEGLGWRNQIQVEVTTEMGKSTIQLLLYLPKTDKPAPLFVGLNFGGNHTVSRNPSIQLPKSWVRNSRGTQDQKNRAREQDRGNRMRRWPVKQILQNGFGLATAYYGDIDPDFDDAFKNGVHGLFPASSDDTNWGSISGWAWGLSRLADVLVKQPAVDASSIYLVGHSRLGKTALWAGALDERFAVVISNNSGCGGAAISRRRFGETVARINQVFPHWFCDRFRKYNDREQDLPVDQHMLLALMAPRPVYVASASEDRWADPRGEFLAAQHSQPAFQLYGLPTSLSEFPTADESIGATVGYHLRTGKHDLTASDWQMFMQFCQRSR